MSGAGSQGTLRIARNVHDAPVSYLHVSSVARRAGAYALDHVALGVLALIGGLVASAVIDGGVHGGANSTQELAMASAFAAGGAVVLWVTEGVWGWTLGGLLLGLRTVNERTMRPAGLGRILLRNIVVALGLLLCGVGNWLVVVSGRFERSNVRRGWHDQWAGTIVIRPRDTKLGRR